jgi:hypothetical protein
LEWAKGYVKALGKSTSPFVIWGEVFEHFTESYSASEKRLTVVLKVLFCPTSEWFGRVGEKG